jgi:nucleolin
MQVRLHTDKDTRQSKGYAHVHFADEGGLDKALGMSGIDFMGRGIKVSYAQPKKA